MKIKRSKHSHNIILQMSSKPKSARAPQPTSENIEVCVPRNLGGCFPAKRNADSASYDVTLVGRKANRIDDRNYDVNDFNTGMWVNPPKGYYLEFRAADVLHGQGYNVMGGSVIIEHAETLTEVTIPLFKFKETSDLQLPCNCMKMILHEICSAHVKRIEDVGVTQQTTTTKYGFESAFDSPAVKPSPHQQGRAPPSYFVPEINPGLPPQSTSRPARYEGNNHMF